jgi:hypothetical protein
VDRRLADEAARYSKLDTEHRLLKRENSKTEVNCIICYPARCLGICTQYVGAL